MGRKLTNRLAYSTLYLLFFSAIVLPLLYTFGKALFFDSSLSSNIHQLNTTTFYLIGKSIFIAFAIAILSTFFGTILGFILFKTKLKYTSFFKIALLIPLFIPSYILAVAWKDFLFIFMGKQAVSQPFLGVLWVLISVYTPLSMLIIGSAFSRINSQLEEAGLLVVNSFKVVFKITLPLIKPALISSFVLIFIFSISEFTVPALFGVRVFTTEIFTQFAAFYNHSLAILQSLLLVFICVLLLIADRKQLGNAVFLSVGNKGVKNYLYDWKTKKNGILLFLMIWLFATVVFPLLTLLYQSFKDGTDSFIKAFQLLRPTFVDSLVLAFAGAFISVVIGFVVAYHSNKGKQTNTPSFNWFLLLVFAIPSSVLGISFIQFYNQPSLDFIYSSLLLIVFAYVGKFSFISTKLLANALKQLPDSLEEAAQIQGVSSFHRILKITVPLIAKSLIVAFVLIFIFSFSEIATTIMLYPPGVELMPIKIYTIMANAPQSLTSSMVLILLITILSLVLSFYFTANYFLKKMNS